MPRKSRKIPTGEWLTGKLERILEMTKIISEECPGQITEPEYGFWSLKKEIALMYWIWPFLQIADKYFNSYYYIDLFAGSGLAKAEATFFVGSPLVAICSTLPDKKFNQFICFELDEARKNALEERASIAAKHFGTNSPKIFNSDCNQKLKPILEALCPNDTSCFLAFIDPQRIGDLKWNTIHQLLVHGKGDVILNFPTSGIIRNLNVNRSRRTLSDFFGDNSWSEITNSDDLINHYMGKIARYGKAVDNLPVTDEYNHRLYDLIFATGSKGMNNVMSDMKAKLERIKTKDFRNVHEVIAGPQKQLTGY